MRKFGESVKPQTLQVIGVGYGRTGTDSLKEALNILGYKTFHTKEMFQKERIFGHFDDTVFRFDHAEMRQPNFTVIGQAGYNATMDMPMSLYYKELYEEYPDAKFILSVRNSPDEWMESWRSLIETVGLVMRFAPFLPNAYMIDRYNRWLMAILHGGDDAFLTMPHPQVTAAQDHRATESYLAHNDAVRRLIPNKQLLEIDLSDGLGWTPICDFLEVNECPPPGLAFPKANSQAEVRKQVLGVIVGANVILLFIFLLLARSAFRLYGDMRREQNISDDMKKAKED